MKALELEHAENRGEWIEWSGGIVPLPPYTMVEVLTTDLSYSKDKVANFSWLTEFTNIARYRVALTEYPTAEDEEFQRIEKQARYTGEDGKDLIDRWSERYTGEEFRLIMLAMIEKYMTRMGRKDSIAKECRKIADYANRLALVEESRE